MFNFLPRDVRFYDYFERQSENILKASALLHDLVHDFRDARAKTHLIKEHAGDLITHEIVRKLTRPSSRPSTARTSTPSPRVSTTCTTTSGRPRSGSSWTASRSPLQLVKSVA